MNEELRLLSEQNPDKLYFSSIKEGDKPQLGQGNYTYCFYEQGTYKELPLEEAKALVNAYPNFMRNCKISMDRVMLKSKCKRSEVIA